LTESSPTTKTKAASKDAWKQANVHTGVTLPSGTIVDITIPSLPRLIKSGQVPNHLIDIAVEQGSAEKIDKEVLEQTWEFTKFIIPQMLVNPEITEDDVEDLPALDLELLIGFASRVTDLDAIGHQLGGLETQDSFRNVRGLDLTTSDLLNL
jgi:hypothetical protein